MMGKIKEPLQILDNCLSFVGKGKSSMAFPYIFISIFCTVKRMKTRKNQKPGVPNGWAQSNFVLDKALDGLGRKVLFPQKLAQSNSLLAQAVWD